MTARMKLMSWMMVATAFAGAATACSDDEAKKSDTPATVAAGGDAEAGGDASANPEVAAFCKAADDLAIEFKKVMADPASGNITALSVTATELTAKATALSGSSPDDAQEVNDCLAKMSAAMTGG